jgi:hypothetical protein
MEATKTEREAVSNVLNRAEEVAVRELSDLELALVGGGLGEVVIG